MISRALLWSVIIGLLIVSLAANAAVISLDADAVGDLYEKLRTLTLVIQGAMFAVFGIFISFLLKRISDLDRYTRHEIRDIRNGMQSINAMFNEWTQIQNSSERRVHDAVKTMAEHAHHVDGLAHKIEERIWQTQQRPES